MQKQLTDKQALLDEAHTREEKLQLEVSESNAQVAALTHAEKLVRASLEGIQADAAQILEEKNAAAASLLDAQRLSEELQGKLTREQGKTWKTKLAESFGIGQRSA